MDVVVDPEWVSDHLGDVILADVRWYLDGRSGREAFEASHLPGALFVDLDRDLTTHGEPTAGRHPLPTPSAFADSMGRLGIGDDDVVVAYDDSGGGTAGRLVWMLLRSGHQAALLDGGLAAWAGPRESGPSGERPVAAFTTRPWPADALVDTAVVAAIAASGDAPLLDARAPERYRGETETVDARAGHIPGATSAPWQANLDPATGRFRPRDALRARFEALGARPDATVVAYCGSGVSACANLLALELAGFADTRLYVASWSGWSADPERPAATGDDGAPE